MEEPTAEKLRRFVRVNKEKAAVDQLTAAIVIWVYEGDVAPIHTLAAAAHDCFHWMVKHKEQESILREWMSHQSKGLQKRISDAQNFFKHGHKWLKGEVKYPVLYGELLMFDAVICHGMLFGVENTPAIFRLYAARFTLENTDILRRNLSRFFIERDVIEELRPLNRQQFFERGLRLIG